MAPPLTDKVKEDEKHIEKRRRKLLIINENEPATGCVVKSGKPPRIFTAPVGESGKAAGRQGKRTERVAKKRRNYSSPRCHSDPETSGEESGRERRERFRHLLKQIPLPKSRDRNDSPGEDVEPVPVSILIRSRWPATVAFCCNESAVYLYASKNIVDNKQNSDATCKTSPLSDNPAASLRFLFRAKEVDTVFDATFQNKDLFLNKDK